MQQNCLFCVEKRFALNKMYALPAEEAIIWEDENVFIVPDLFPLVVGHLLIVSKNHYSSYANAPTEVIRSLKKAIRFVNEELCLRQDAFLFEHGSVLENAGGSSINHAHLHILPINFDIQKEIAMCAPTLKISDVVSIDDLYILAEKNQPYLFCQSPNKQPVVYEVDRLPSQFLRSIIAKKIGCEFDWKKIENRTAFISKFRKTIAYFGGNHDKAN